MTVRDLRDTVRRAPSLGPDDTAAKAVRLMRAKGVPALPVAESGAIIGITREGDVLELAAGASDARRVLRTTTVSQIMRPVGIVASETQPLRELALVLRQLGADSVPVVDEGGRFRGILLTRDILAALAGEPVVPPVAGLATPRGVYLTTGALRAGASDLGLATTGGALMALDLIAAALVFRFGWLLGHFLSAPDEVAAGPPAAVGVAAVAAFYGLRVLIFLLLLRLSPLTGIHGAEHMVVRAIEEGEDLTPEKVREMPRVHPRCGTNLLALLILLVIAQQFLSRLGGVDEASRIFALFVLVMVVLLTWKRLGAGLQRWVTTKRPSDRQLAAAIEVAEDLLGKARAHPSAATGLPRRIWNGGFIQVLAGFFLVALLAEYAPVVVAQLWRAAVP